MSDPLRAGLRPLLCKGSDLDEMRVATRLLSGLMDSELDLHVRSGPRVA